MPNVPCKINGKVNPEYRRQYYLENRERMLNYQKKYRQDNPEKSRQYNKRADVKQRLKYPERLRARDLAKYHVSIDPCCELCKSIENLERHHPDYSKPLEIMTLCRDCHYEIHR